MGIVQINGNNNVRNIKFRSFHSSSRNLSTTISKLFILHVRDIKDNILAVVLKKIVVLRRKPAKCPRFSAIL